MELQLDPPTASLARPRATPPTVPTLATPLRLPCGLVLPNRVAKAGMSEGLADAHGAPSDRLLRLYRRWAEGDAGLLVTGNAVIDPHHVERPGNVVVVSEADLPGLARWAEAAQSGGAAGILQIGHAGRQTSRFVNPQPTAPSAVRAVKFFRVFGTPRAASAPEVREIQRRFVATARLAERAGWAGVQIHAAHGYLLNQFLSPATNVRDDAWGGSVANRARLLLDIVREVRASTRPGFAVTVKLNTSDYQHGALDEDDAAEVVALLEREGIDLLELSGGTYESGASFGEGVAPSDREAYFARFAARVRGSTRVPLMLTGGFRSRPAMERALREDVADVVGLGRPMALEPGLARRLLTDPEARAQPSAPRLRSRALRGAAEMAWYWRQMVRVADGLEPDPTLSMAWSFVVRVAWDVAGARRLRHATAG